MPLPCTTRTRGKPARNARSTNLSTSRVASSTVRPITLISLGTLAPSFPSDTEIPRARATFNGESAALASTSAISSRAIFIFIEPTSTSK